jgi:nucleotide-binding universal stress UspA family protein
MIRIKNVLVATDFSEPSTAALDYGRELARTYEATLHVLHVTEDLRWRFAADATPAFPADAQEEIEASARARTNALLTDEDRAQLHARAAVQTAVSPAESIVEYAKTQAADVIVIGTHGRSGFSRVLMGSVAERVVRLAPCPVLTVRHPEHEFIAPDALVLTTKA